MSYNNDGRVPGPVARADFKSYGNVTPEPRFLQNSSNALYQISRGY